MRQIDKTQFGDWQTNKALCLSVCRMLKSNGIAPQVVIEPSCGIGNFISASLDTFDTVEEVYGVEINKDYVGECLAEAGRHNRHNAEIHILNDNVFNVDFSALKRKIHGKSILILGNPPWVTNSKIGSIEGDNLPTKSNFKGQKGLEAITGKGNFDIAEYISYQMMTVASGENCHIALLLKNSVIKNIVYEQKNGRRGIERFRQYQIDTNKEFNASVSSSLLVCESGRAAALQCSVYDFYTGDFIKTFGWEDDKFVADCKGYALYKEIEGTSPIKWWSGIKHDCSKVMELERKEGHYVNGLKETVDIEEGIVFPFLKSSDLKERVITKCRKYFILTQHRTGENTAAIKNKFPKAYDYLLSHESFLNSRKSIIYKNNYKFSIFGVGPYAFSKYKIVISGLYKQTRFSLVSQIEGKTALLDDTTYLMGFENKAFAELTLKILNSSMVQGFMDSILFEDAKRPINKDLLMRIDLVAAARSVDRSLLGVSEYDFGEYISFLEQDDLYPLFKYA